MLIFNGSAFHVSVKIEISKYEIKPRKCGSCNLDFKSLNLKLRNLMSFWGYFPFHVIAIFERDRFYNT